MKVVIVNPRNGHKRQCEILNFDELADFCSLVGIDLNIKMKSGSFEDNERNIKSKLSETYEPYHIDTENLWVASPKTPENFVDAHMQVLTDPNLSYKYHDGFDTKLLGKCLIYVLSRDPKRAEVLLNPLTHNWFDDLTAQKAYEELLKVNTFTSLHMAERLMNSKLWKIKPSDGG